MQCSECQEDKSSDQFYVRGASIRGICKKCHNKKAADRVAATRRKTKAKLVEAHGNKCIDCGNIYPPFVMDFDHRDPSEKAFGIGGQDFTRAYELSYAESLKCDLVCANCHRFRTHKQRCSGCEYCDR